MWIHITVKFSLLLLALILFRRFLLPLTHIPFIGHAFEHKNRLFFPCFNRMRFFLSHSLCNLCHINKRVRERLLLPAEFLMRQILFTLFQPKNSIFANFNYWRRYCCWMWVLFFMLLTILCSIMERDDEELCGGASMPRYPSSHAIFGKQCRWLRLIMP